MNTRRATIKSSNATFLCLTLLVLTVVSYLYFLNMSVVQVVMRTEYIQEQNKISAEIAMLEARYIESQHKVATRIASLDGYNTEIEKIFVSRKQDSLVLGGN